MNDECTRVTGKQVLLDAVTLAKDAGAYIYDLSKRAFTAIKHALKSKDKDEKKDADCEQVIICPSDNTRS